MGVNGLHLVPWGCRSLFLWQTRFSVPPGKLMFGPLGLHCLQLLIEGCRSFFLSQARSSVPLGKLLFDPLPHLLKEFIQLFFGRFALLISTPLRRVVPRMRCAPDWHSAYSVVGQVHLGTPMDSRCWGRTSSTTLSRGLAFFLSDGQEREA